MKRKFAIQFFILASLICHAQTNFLDNFFWTPDNDSLLWKSPLAPRQVTNQGIEKVEIKRKFWHFYYNRYGCGVEPKLKKKKYEFASTIYTYDSLGYPIKINLKDFADSRQNFVFKCINTYTINGQLIKSELFRFDAKKDSLFLISTVRKAYNKQGLVTLTQVYSSYNNNLMCERKYVYYKQGYLMQYDEYEPRGDKNEFKQRNKILFSANGKLLLYANTGSVADTNSIFEAYHKRVFNYDKTGIYTGSYNLTGKDTTQKSYEIKIKSGVGTVFTGYNDFSDKELRTAKEVRDDKVYFWEYSYDFIRFSASCLVSDQKTGLPLNSRNNYNRTKNPRYIRLNRIKRPRNPFKINFTRRPNISEYTYTKR
ncbi:MAG: hypothetical protein IT236_03030 [Bacteroidia bacterium]|nr:hypothetical protein [Bacteroidia bacterium]